MNESIRESGVDDDRPTFPDDPATQHSHLSRLILELGAAVYACEPVGALDFLARGLLDDAREHFRAEEEVMQETGYPALDEHRQQHTSLLARIEVIRNSFSSGASSSGMTELAAAFSLHEQTMDEEMLRYFRGFK
ncbi:MAG: hemerythrin family protein [Polyangiaceae bacterium]